MPLEKSNTQEPSIQNRFANVDIDQLEEQEQQSIVELAIKVLESKVEAKEQLQGSQDVKKFLRLKMADYKREVFAVLFLDNHHRIISYEEMFQGSINTCNVYCREIVKRALEFNAGAIILAHNHPSGLAEPSPADIHITKTIKDILNIIDVRVLDHLIVGEMGVVSMGERNLI